MPRQPIKPGGSAAASVITVSLAPQPANVRVARQVVNEELKSAELSSPVAVLLVSELVTNVILHAKTDFQLVVDVTETRIRVEVHDGVAVTGAFREQSRTTRGA